MSNIFKKPKSKVAPSYNGMDMSKSIKFTSSVGHLLPVLYDRLDPGDAITIRSSIYTRTQPLNTAAFTRVTEHIDYFFVPMSMINSFFENQFYGIQDISSSLLFQNSSGSSNQLPSVGSVGLPRTMPTIPFSLVTNSIQQEFDNRNGGVLTTIDEFGVPAAFNAVRLMSLLGYSEHTLLGRHIDKSGISDSDFVDNPNINLDYLYCYHRIFSDYYRLSTWEQNDPFSYSEDYLLRYKESAKLTQTSYLPPFLHYSKNVSSSIPAFSNYNRKSPFTIRYRPWKRDYFTNVEPSPLYDVSNNIYRNSSAGVDEASLDINKILGDTTAYNNQDLMSFEILRDGTSANLFLDPGDSQGVSISPVLLNILNSWQKNLSVTQRAKKHYNDQTFAHYGFKVPQGVSDEVYFLGSHSSRLRISEVISTATTGSGTDSSVLGEIAGKGNSGNTNGRKIKFKAPCHGILMALYSAVPESDYLATGIDRTNLYTSILHYYHPALDRLGYQPLLLREYDIAQDSNVVVPTLLGWSYRYSEVKTKYDTIHGAFCYSLANWVTPRDVSLIYHTTSNNNIAADNAGVLATYYINPSTLNPIMELDFYGNIKQGVTTPKKTSVNVGGKTLPLYDGTPVYATDPLLHNIDFQYYKSTKKSTYGLPNY